MKMILTLIISPKLYSGNCEGYTKLFAHIEALFPVIAAMAPPQRNCLTQPHFYATIICVAARQHATVAQPVEQLTRNEQVVRSNRISSSSKGSEAVFTASGLFFLLRARAGRGSAGTPPGSSPETPAGRSRAGPAAEGPATDAAPRPREPLHPAATAAAGKRPGTGADGAAGRSAAAGTTPAPGRWSAPAAAPTAPAG